MQPLQKKITHKKSRHSNSSYRQQPQIVGSVHTTKKTTTKVCFQALIKKFNPQKNFPLYSSLLGYCVFIPQSPRASWLVWPRPPQLNPQKSLVRDYFVATLLCTCIRSTVGGGAYLQTVPHQGSSGTGPPLSQLLTSYFPNYTISATETNVPAHTGVHTHACMSQYTPYSSNSLCTMCTYIIKASLFVALMYTAFMCV